MKETFLSTAMRNAAKRIPLGLGLALAVAILHPNATARATDVPLGTDNNFAVLAGSTVTSTGNTVVNGGNIGVSTGSAITGFRPGILDAPYTFHHDDAVAIQAQSDLTTAFNAAKNASATTSYGAIYKFADGTTLGPGVYHGASSLEISGTLTLTGTASDVWIFQADASTLTADLGSKVVLTGGAQANNVFWEVGSSATLDGSDFVGNILAYATITDSGYSTVHGRLLAETGAVNLDYTIIEAPDTGSTLLLLGYGLAALCAFGRRFSVLLR